MLILARYGIFLGDIKDRSIRMERRSLLNVEPMKWHKLDNKKIYGFQQDRNKYDVGHFCEYSIKTGKTTNTSTSLILDSEGRTPVSFRDVSFLF
jgi:hypothetical protein